MRPLWELFVQRSSDFRDSGGRIAPGAADSDTDRFGSNGQKTVVALSHKVIRNIRNRYPGSAVEDFHSVIPDAQRYMGNLGS